MNELTPDLAGIGADLAGAIRRDHARSMRRHRAARTVALSIGASAALSGSALGAGEALGVIDLGGGVTANRVTQIPDAPPGAPAAAIDMPYKYRIEMPRTGDPKLDGNGVYMSGEKPLEPGSMLVQRGRASGHENHTSGPHENHTSEPVVREGQPAFGQVP